MRAVIVASLAWLVAAHPAAAQDGPLHQAIAKAFVAQDTAVSDDPQSPAPRQVAFEYSEGYRTRAKIHKYASFATLPLFATEFALGQSLYNNTTQTKKSAHVAIGSGIIGLYGVQAVTGVWNLVEGRKDPHAGKRRLVHSILMLASGAGFAITPMLAPSEHDAFAGGGSRSAHRAMAFTSIGIGTAGYLTMLIGGK